MEQIVALYLRLSKADSRKNGGMVSGSIQNQRALLEQYVRQDAGLCFYEASCFIDDGYSGLKDNRPALQNMLSMVRDGRVYAVAVKDFSRLSRNHLFLASLREKVFPACKTEFISLGDHYDSRIDGGDLLTLRFKSLFYEYYCRDISRKVKASLSAKKEKGEYAVARVPFGYRMVDGRWRIEDGEAALVRDIFQLAAAGHTYSKIAVLLEKDNPVARLYPVKVMRILQNPVYCGKHVWHKYESYLGLHKKSVALPKEQWRVEEGNHPPIVSEELFWQANGRMDRKAFKGKERTTSDYNDF